MNVRSFPALAAQTAVALVLALAGCASTEPPLPPLPHYPADDVALTLDFIRAQAARLDHVNGRGAVTLSSPARGAIRLDAAFVLAPPDRARIRAWKFNQAVFDLTVVPEGVWLYTRDDGSQTSQTAGGGIREWLGYLRRGVPADAERVRDNAQEIVVASHTDAGVLEIRIDRPTRTVRGYRLTGPSGEVRFVLTLSRYRALGAALWPTRIIAAHGRETITLETDDVDDGPAPSAAFSPPARARKLP